MYSEQTAVSGGFLSFLDLTIQYRDRSEITVQFDDVPASAWSWSGTVEHRIVFSPTVAAGVVVKVLRNTDISAMTHVFAAGAAFRNTTMDDDFLQLLHAVQELQERGGTGGGGGGGVSGALNVGGGPHELFKQNALGVLQFRTIAAGPNVSISMLADVLTISATGGGGGGTSDHGGLTGLADDDHPQYFNQARGDLRYSLLGHTHSLSSLTASGAIAGQVPTFNGTAWVPATPSTGGGGGSTDTVIAVIGDSESARNANLGPAWPELLQDNLNAAGGRVRVLNFAINGHSYRRANTVTSFGAGTAVQAAIAAEPDIVLVMLGINDTINAVDGRSLAQVQGDATAVFSALRTALPSATIVYLSQTPYDTTHGIPSTLVNRQVMPHLMQLPSSGILSGCFCSEMLPNAVSTTNRNRVADWVSLDTTIKGLGTLSGSYNVNLWRTARMGTCGYDGLHFTAAGHVTLSSYVRRAFKDLVALQSAVPGLMNQSTPIFDDPDALFTGLLTDNGTEWVAVEPTTFTAHVVNQLGPWVAQNAGAWFLPSKGSLTTSTLANLVGQPFTWALTGVQPFSQIQTSMNGAAWVNAHARADGAGRFLESGTFTNAQAGSYTFRYKSGNEIHGPIALTVTATGGGGSSRVGTISGALLDTGGTLSAAANAQLFIPYDATNVVNSNPSVLSLASVGNERRITISTAGGPVWFRVSASVGVATGTTMELGYEFLTPGTMTLQFRIPLARRTVAGGQVLSGSFVGRAASDLVVVPYVWTIAAAGSISNAAFTQSSALPNYWAVEVNMTPP